MGENVDCTAGWPVRVPIGYRTGPYEVVAPIAHGSWSSVYAGRQLPRVGGALSEGLEVALKFLPAQRTTPGQRSALAEVIRREIAAAGRWTHPNLVRTHEALTVSDPSSPTLDGSLIIVMDLAVTSLRDLLADAAPGRPLTGAERILADIAGGLGHLHTAGWLHGDLKPANVLLDTQGACRLADFGLAAELETTHAYLPQAGTTDYLPPEYWSEYTTPAGHPVRTTADLWAFGVTAHLVLTGGLHPFPGTTGQARLAAVLSYARDTAPLRLSDQLPAGWRELVADCLAPDHARRSRLSAAKLHTRITALGPPGRPRLEIHSPARPNHRPHVPSMAHALRGPARWLSLLVLLTALATGSTAPARSWTSGGELRPGAAVPAQYRQIIVNAAHSYENDAVTPSLIAAIVATQSGFDPTARRVGVDGTAEYGIAGWTPRVFAYFAVDARGDGRPDYLDPMDAIYSMANQLSWLDHQLGDLPGDRALLLAAAYHTSTKYVRSTGTYGPENAAYVRRVHACLGAFTDPRNGRLPAAAAP